MARYLVRVWLPDRPGALGAVASRIGALRGDVLGLEILERDGGVAVDELTVELPSDDLIPLLLREIAQVEGCTVEECRPAPGSHPGPVRVVVDTVARLARQLTSGGAAAAAVAAARQAVRADWAMVVDRAGDEVVAVSGSAPHPRWTAALCDGLGAGSVGASGERTVAMAPVTAEGLALVVGRSEHPLRSAELELLEGIAVVTAARLCELALGGARALHPSGASRAAG